MKNSLIYFGPMTKVPTVEADITVLPATANTTDPVLLNTGTNSIFIIALPAGKIIEQVFDITVNENITSEYILSTIMLGTTPYGVYVMKNMMPYSINHVHQISIIDG